jgi:CDP-diacylglycerol--glycerol-3-phosphate 3-phosphatidyltransferase
MSPHSRWTLPNVLSASRLAMAPILLLLAFAAQRETFLWVLGAAFFTDAADGIIARTTGQVTRFGAVLDSWADLSIYTTIAVSMALLWPTLLHDEGLAICAVVTSFALPALVGLLRFGHFTSYHTWLVKLAVGSTAAGLFIMLLGYSTVPFRIGAMLAVLAGVEEVAITLLSREERPDVPGLWAVIGKRRKPTDRGS